MTDFASWLTARVPAGRDLDEAELTRLAVEVGAERSLWTAHVRHSPETRHYVQLYRDPHVDVWLICWLNAQDTGYHDHDLSSGAVHVCDGTLCEDFFWRGDDGWIREQSRAHHAGGTFHFPAHYIHGVRHPTGGPPATSIHVYSPALWRMGHYDADAFGVMGRRSVTYADELAATGVTVG